jgi:DNA repair protein RadC
MKLSVKETAEQYLFKEASDEELLANLLGISDEKANTCIKRIGSLERMKQMSVMELSRYMTRAQAIKVKNAIMFCRRLFSPNKNSQHIRTPEDVYTYMAHVLPDQQVEYFLAILLNTKNKIIGHEMISKGSLSQSVVHPREVLKVAILYRASAFIIVHNHPSGNPTPSQPDIEMSRRVRDSGEIIGIDMLDSVILGDGDFVSLKEQGLLD